MTTNSNVIIILLAAPGLKRLKKPVIFPTESKVKHINLKRTEIITHLRGLSPPQYLVLYAKVVLALKKKLLNVLISWPLCFRSRS